MFLFCFICFHCFIIIFFILFFISGVDSILRCHVSKQRTTNARRANHGAQLLLNAHCVLQPQRHHREAQRRSFARLSSRTTARRCRRCCRTSARTTLVAAYATRLFHSVSFDLCTCTSIANVNCFVSSHFYCYYLLLFI